MTRCDWFFFGGMAAYIVCALVAWFTQAVPVEVVQFVWITYMAAALVWPRFARFVGIKPPLWGGNT